MNDSALVFGRKSVITVIREEGCPFSSSWLLLLEVEHGQIFWGFFFWFLLFCFLFKRSCFADVGSAEHNVKVKSGPAPVLRKLDWDLPCPPAYRLPLSFHTIAAELNSCTRVRDHMIFKTYPRYCLALFSFPTSSVDPITHFRGLNSISWIPACRFGPLGDPSCLRPMLTPSALFWLLVAVHGHYFDPWVSNLNLQGLLKTRMISSTSRFSRSRWRLRLCPVNMFPVEANILTPGSHTEAQEPSIMLWGGLRALTLSGWWPGERGWPRERNEFCRRPSTYSLRHCMARTGTWGILWVLRVPRICDVSWVRRISLGIHPGPTPLAWKEAPTILKCSIQADLIFLPFTLLGFAELFFNKYLLQCFWCYYCKKIRIRIHWRCRW